MIDLELIRSRHSVRSYLDRPIEEDIVAKLQAEIDACNEESGLNIQLFTNEPNAFNANKPHYGKFSGCKNYLAMIGPRGCDEQIGFFGERLATRFLTPVTFASRARSGRLSARGGMTAAILTT